MPGMSEKFHSFGNEEEIKKVFEIKPDLEATNRDDDLEESIKLHNLAKNKDKLIENPDSKKEEIEQVSILLDEYGEKQKAILEEIYSELSDLILALKTENYPKEDLEDSKATVRALLLEPDTNLSVQASHHYRSSETGIEVNFETNDSLYKKLCKVLEKDSKDFSEEDFGFLDNLETIVYGAKMQFSKFLEKQAMEN